MAEMAETTSKIKADEGTGAPPPPKGVVGWVVDGMFWVSLAMLLWVYFAQRRVVVPGPVPFIGGAQIWDSWDPAGFAYTASHVGAAGVMTSIWFLAKKRPTLPRWILALFFLGSYALGGYYFQHNSLELLFRPSYGTAMDLGIGLAMLVSATWLSWLYWGAVFPLLGGIFVGYMFIADLLPGPLKGPPLDTQNILTRIVQKQFSDIVVLAAGFLWALVFWGLLMGSVGGGVALLALARKMSQGIAGGPAIGSLISSAITGSFVGGGASNVAITGPVTIPAMKKAGYSPEEAASVEAMASNASAITPPILGAVAFVMSDFLGVSYFEIILMSIVPALLWFLAVGVWIMSHAQKNRRRITAITLEAGATGETASLYVRSALIILIPVSLIVALVIQGYTLKTATMAALVTTVLIALVLRVETRLSAWIAAIRNAAYYASSLTVIVVIVAIISDALTFTGLGGRLGNVIVEISQGQLIIAASIMVVVGIILGGPLPALPIYFIMIVTFAPALAKMGVPHQATHYVAFYMGNLGSISLPVAASCLVAAAIAQTKYWPTAVVTAKVSWPLWVYPLLFAIAPELLLLSDPFPDGSVRPAFSSDHAFVIGASAIVMVGVQSATGGWMFRDLARIERGLLFSTFAILTAGLVARHKGPGEVDAAGEALGWVLVLVAIGIVVAIAVVAFLSRKGGKAKASASAAAPPPAAASRGAPPAG